MKQIFKQYRAVVAMLAAILLLSVGLTALNGGLDLSKQKDDRHAVLATTYPVYVAAQHIIGDNTPIRLTRLDGAAPGCLPDYQLSPSDRRAVQQAEIILMNGAGAESFLHGIVEEEKCVDTSAGIDLLCADHHEEGEDHHHEDEYNEHLWLSPTRYGLQVAAVRDALCELDPGCADTYRANAAAYLAEITVIADSLPDLSGRPCVLFHDSMS